MAMRRTPLLERRPLQRKAEPAPPLPIQLDVFKTIRTTDGKQIQTSQSVAELFYAERYSRKFTKDVWAIRWSFNTALLYGWNLQALPLKVELQNAGDVNLFMNLTGVFAGPGTIPGLAQWNQAICVLPGTVLTIPDLGAINTDDNSQKFIEVFQAAPFTSFEHVLILYFADPVSAPVQYTPP